VPSESSAAEVFAKALSGGKISVEDSEVFKGYMTYFLMSMYAKKNISTELHLGAMRNNNTVMLGKLGLDSGFDSISGRGSIDRLSALLDRLNSENALPRTVIFNLNPRLNAEILALSGCFQDGSVKSKINYGAAWWFLDNKPGMEKHLTDLCALGHIGAFLGMLTDSRSFVSYPRHDYFRRILCSHLGKMMDDGLMTDDLGLVGKVVKDICYNNAIRYFNVE
jgi:glucuronate isomerase